MEPKLTYEQLRSVDQTFHLVFKEVMGEAPAIVGLAREVSNDATDIRTLLRATVQNADHVKTRQLLQSAADNYERFIHVLIECATRAEALIELAKDGNYQEWLKQFFAIATPDFKTETGKQRLLGILRIQGLLSSKELTWAFAFKNFFNVLRNIDAAQSLVLDRPYRGDRWKRIAKAIAADAFGATVPILATLVALAENQTVEIDKRLGAMQQATDEIERVLKFEDIALRCIDVLEFVNQIMDQARTEELRFKESFEEEFPAQG
jgi:hypothetical protein